MFGWCPDAVAQSKYNSATGAQRGVEHCTEKGLRESSNTTDDDVIIIERPEEEATIRTSQNEEAVTDLTPILPKRHDSTGAEHAPRHEKVNRTRQEANQQPDSLEYIQEPSRTAKQKDTGATPLQHIPQPDDKACNNSRQSFLYQGRATTARWKHYR